MIYLKFDEDTGKSKVFNYQETPELYDYVENLEIRDYKVFISNLFPDHSYRLNNIFLDQYFRRLKTYILNLKDNSKSKELKKLLSLRSNLREIEDSYYDGRDSSERFYFDINKNLLLNQLDNIIRLIKEKINPLTIPIKLIFLEELGFITKLQKLVEENEGNDIDISKYLSVIIDHDPQSIKEYVPLYKPGKGGKQKYDRLFNRSAKEESDKLLKQFKFIRKGNT